MNTTVSWPRFQWPFPKTLCCPTGHCLFEAKRRGNNNIYGWTIAKKYSVSLISGGSYIWVRLRGVGYLAEACWHRPLSHWCSPCPWLWPWPSPARCWFDHFVVARVDIYEYYTYGLVLACVDNVLAKGVSHLLLSLLPGLIYTSIIRMS